MRKLFAIAALCALGGCQTLTADAPGLTAAAAASAPVQKVATSTYGQLFCKLDQGVEGQIVVAVLDEAASTAGPVAVMAQNSTAAFVADACNAAAAAKGAVSGVPVPPPAASTAPVVAITPPTT